eukprot:13121462-Heterocapsa_arctica.AAC.1
MVEKCPGVPGGHQDGLGATHNEWAVRESLAPLNPRRGRVAGVELVENELLVNAEGSNCGSVPLD